MMYRTVICVLLVGVVGVALACGRAGCGVTSEGTEEPAQEGAVVGGVIAGPSGERTIEERVAWSKTIVRGRLVSKSVEVVQGESDWSDYYYILQTFEVAASEYLLGSGPGTLRAVVEMAGLYESEEEATAALAAVGARRNTEWDDREAVFFLQEEYWTKFAGYPQRSSANTRYFAREDGAHSYQEMYSFESCWNRLWLPADTRSSATGDGQLFLRAPLASSWEDVCHYPSDYERNTEETISLGELKRKIGVVKAELAKGDGTEAYRKCVQGRYEDRRKGAWLGWEGGSQYVEDRAVSIGSWEAAGGVVYSDGEIGVAWPDLGLRTKVTLAGDDAAYFGVRESEDVDSPYRGRARKLFDIDVVTGRPLAAGEYVVDHKYVPGSKSYCEATYTSEWTVTVTSPDGTLHELFFDPVSVGLTVGADSTNGVLKPAAFTDGNGGSAIIHSISYEAGTVKVEVTPDGALARQVLDFIELDGTVSLSLDVGDATGDAATGSGQAGTLSWSVESQPWEDGDLLMVRIREAR